MSSYRSEMASFRGGPGGEAYDEVAYRAGGLRADLVEVASRVDFRRASQVADLILAEYELERRVL